jgi:cyclopropane fatty-acyl-phospholipid synthase-like methyltransferase
LLFGAVAVLDGSRTSVFVIRSAARSEYRDVQEPFQLSAVDHVARIDFDRPAMTKNSRNRSTQKYIFPGGLIPSARAILEITERETGLRAVDKLSLREHYAETLRLWRERFLQRRKTLGHIGFDEVFARMWELYLADREAGFRSGQLNVYQWTFVNKAAP